MLVWLSQRLEMDYVWGPAADSAWGNAVLSRFPITEFRNHEMPNNGALLFDRAFLTAEVDVGGGETLVVIATHFHAGDGDSAIRVPQAQAVLEAVDSDRTTVLLGDLNARPDHPEMLLITGAGLNDTFVASGTSGDGLTSPADAPTERIDYVWASPDLKVRDFLSPTAWPQTTSPWRSRSTGDDARRCIDRRRADSDAVPVARARALPAR